MTAFAAIITGVQSADGKTLTLTDGSPYGSNTEGYVIGTFTSRQVVLTSSDGTILATLDLGSGLTVTFALTKDQYITVTLNLGTTGPYTAFTNLGLERNAQNLYQTMLAANGCCVGLSTDDKLSAADRYFRGADLALLSGNGAAFDNCIFSAYAYLNS